MVSNYIKLMPITFTMRMLPVSLNEKNWQFQELMRMYSQKEFYYNVIGRVNWHNHLGNVEDTHFLWPSNSTPRFTNVCVTVVYKNI